MIFYFKISSFLSKITPPAVHAGQIQYLALFSLAACACVEKSFAIWKETASKRSAQLIFCDLSTPKGDGTFNVYDDLKKKLMAKGVPEAEIAFIHDANTEVKKTDLFNKVKSGQVRFLLGSTAKMGAGTRACLKNILNCLF